MKGFSKFNLYHIRNFYLFYSQEVKKVEQVALLLEDASKTKQSFSQIEKWEQVVPKLETQLFNIPWGHHLVILKKIKNRPEAIFYI